MGDDEFWNESNISSFSFDEDDKVTASNSTFIH